MIIGTYEELEIGKIYPSPDRIGIATLSDADRNKQTLFRFVVVRKATFEEYKKNAEQFGSYQYESEFAHANFYEVRMD